MHEVDPVVALVAREAPREAGAQREVLHLLLEAGAIAFHTPTERIIEAVKDEVVDLTARALARVGALPSSERNRRWFDQARQLLTPGTPLFPRADLTALAAAMREATRATPDAQLAALAETAEEMVAKHHALERRVDRLLHPPRFEEVQKLDPRRDYNAIYHFLSYEFRTERVLFSTLYEVRPVVVPHAITFFTATGEFIARSARRVVDTVLLFDNLGEWGLDSLRGRAAIDRINSIHGRYNIPNDTFKFILGNVMFVPVLWNQRLGWRRWSDVERLGWFYQHHEFGRAMNIQGVSEDYDEALAWWLDYARRHAKPSDVTRKAFENIVVQVLATLPESLRPLVLQATIAGMDDIFRATALFPETPPEVLAAVRSVLFTAGHLGAALPRTPWIRSLQDNPTYPFGYRMDELGVYRRGYSMPEIPAPAGDASAEQRPLNSNRGYPENVLPIASAAEVQPVELPWLSWEEIRKHRTAEDAWLVIGEFVYDVTSFLTVHPGGHEVLLAQLGQDASAAFARIGHTPEALILSTNFRIGRVAAAAAAGEAR
jgi:hypothetical protein